MQYIKTLALIILGTALLSSCSPTLSPFTGSVYDDFGTSQDQLSKVQYYLSSDIVLYRDFGASETLVDRGTIKMVNGRKVEEVIFKKGTPGVFLFSPKRDRVAIGFENNENNYLMFGTNPKAGGRFTLLAKKWKNRRGKVTYAGSTWNTSAESAYANLLVDIDRTRKTKHKTKTVSGRRVGSQP